MKMNWNTQNLNREFGPPTNRPNMALNNGPITSDSSIRQPPAQNTSDRSPAIFSRTKDRRKAKRILRREAHAPIAKNASLSRMDFIRLERDIAWAKLVLPDFDLDRANNADGNASQENLIVTVENNAPHAIQEQEIPLRSDTSETRVCVSFTQPFLQSQTGAIDAPRSAPSRTNLNQSQLRPKFADIAKGRKIIAVIDRGHASGNIPREKWDWIQATLNSILLDVVEENLGPPPSCRSAGWFQGCTKLIACDNVRSAFIYKTAVSKIGEIYPGAQLDVVEVVDIPSRPWATAWLPHEPSESIEILDILSKCNPEMPTTNWKVIKAIKFEEDAMKIVFQIDLESIEYLSKRDGLLNYASNRIQMKFYKSQKDVLSNLDAFATAVDPPTDDELEANVTDS